MKSEALLYAELVEHLSRNDPTLARIWMQSLSPDEQALIVRWLRERWEPGLKQLERAFEYLVKVVTAEGDAVRRLGDALSEFLANTNLPQPYYVPVPDVDAVRRRPKVFTVA